jgi:Secretion system C-terminal sorting domain
MNSQTMRKLFLVSFLLFSSQLAAQTATWADNVACIFYTHCTKCHNPNGIGPFSLLSYQPAFDNSSAIFDAVTTGYMPPWPPDQNYRSFAHERVLTTEQVNVIANWVNAGAPQGNLANAPTPPTYGATVITAPDLAVQIPTYTLTNDTWDDYRCFVIPTGISSASYITGIEIIPGNRQAVHHVVLYQDPSGVPAANDLADPGPGYTSFGGVGSPNATMVGLWVPGDQPIFYPPNMGVKLDANTNLVAQIHYPAGMLGEVDSTEIRIELTTAAGTREVNIDFVLNHDDLDDGPLVIPADSIRTFHNHYYLPVGSGKITLLSVGPHMHLVGRQIKSFAVDAVGDTTPYIDIPNWNFHWQGMYWFRQPEVLDEGSTIYGEATYDNTSNNPWNPNDPPQLVTAGEATDDEMMIVTFAYLSYQAGDENIIIDTAATAPTYAGCVFTIDRKETVKRPDMEVYPNPTSDQISLSLPPGVAVRNLRITDVNGRTVETISEPGIEMRIPLRNLRAGVYYLTAETDGGLVSRKFVVQ